MLLSYVLFILLVIFIMHMSHSLSICLFGLEVFCTQVYVVPVPPWIVSYAFMTVVLDISIVLSL